jgi:sulfofructose kinase
MDEAFDIVGIGYAGVDHLCEVGAFPRPGEKVLMRQFLQQGGGQIGTAMVALSRWGLRVSAVVAVGDDELGGIALRGLEEEGVDVGAAVVREGVPTQTAFIMAEEGSGERTIVYLRDPRLNLEGGEVDLSILERTRCLYLDGHEEFAVVAARRARELGVPVVLDCERIRPFTEELLGLCDVVLCDSRFPGEFTKLEGVREPLMALARYGMEVLGMTLGERGSVLMSGDRLLRCPAFAVDAVDSTGAGDVFHAGFTYAWLEGTPLEACLDFANAAAALKCTALGGRTAIPRDPGEIQELVRKGVRR